MTRHDAALQSLIDQIQPLDNEAMAAAAARQGRLTKPTGALGHLEALSIRLAGILGEPRPRLPHKVVVVMAGDHGVTVEGISAYPQSVTGQMVLNFLAGGAAINVLARQIGARVVVADMGVVSDLPARPDLYAAKVARGTANIVLGPAMSRDQARQSISAGAALAQREIARGLDILGVGEMGIGNTTAAAALATALTGQDAEEIVGRGTGLDDAGLRHKIDVVRRALATNQLTTGKADACDALDLLSKVGGFEIGGLVGAMLATAAHRRPIMVDGYITTAAAMLAVKLAPAIRPYLLAAHHSAEAGHGAMLAWLELEPLLALDLRLGEGTGAVLGMQIADAACRVLDEMATFDEAGVDNRVA